MADEMKRVRYFTGELLVEKDFTAEQAYHIGMRRRHNRSCHGFGVAEGLTVTKVADRVVRISAGTAFDGEGREIVLVNDVTYTLKEVSANRYLTISYHEEPTDLSTQDGARSETRIAEQPQVQDSANEPPNDRSVILLARLPLTGAGAISSVDLSAVPVAAVSSIAPNAIKPSQLAAGSVTRTAIADGEVVFGKLADSSVKRNAIADGEVVFGKLADNSVKRNAIADGEVVFGKLGDSSVKRNAIADGEVVFGKLAVDSVRREAIAANSITHEKIAKGEISFGLFAIVADAGVLSYSLSANESKEFPTPAIVVDATAPQIVMVSVTPTTGKVKSTTLATRQGNKVAYTVQLSTVNDGEPATGTIRIFTVAAPTG